MTIVLTGATGFVGRAFLRVACQRAAEIRALVRRPADADVHAERGIAPHVGDLTRPETLPGLVQPGDIVVHAAARVEMNAAWSLHQRHTIAATLNLLDAALPARPARFVYVSSAAVYGVANGGPICAARTPPRPTHDNRYGRAKLTAERLVQARCAAAGVAWTVVRLAFLYGPDNRTLASEMRVLNERRRLRIVGPGTNRIATLHVDDAAEAIWLAATHSDAAGRIIDAASDEHVTQAEFVRHQALALGLGPVERHISPPLAYLAGGVAEMVMAAIGETPAISRWMARLMSCDQIIDTAELRSLGWSPRYTFAPEDNGA
jgi:nucleoside-diphosphate-sugar epimerase